MVSFVNTAPTAPIVVLVSPLVTFRARVAMTVPVVESWEEGGGRGEGKERRRREGGGGRGRGREGGEERRRREGGGGV